MTERRRHEHHRYLELPSHWESQSARQPGKLLNATHASFHDPRSGVKVHWNSRQHRKNRYAIAQKPDGKVVRPLRPWWRYRLFGFDWDSISWWIAQFFFWGSICWVVNGWYLFLPTSNEKVDLYVAAYTGLAGGTLFWFGAWLSIVEALNTGIEVRLPHEAHLALHHDLEATADKVHGMHSHHAVAAGLDEPATTSCCPKQTVASEVGSVSTSASGASREKFRWWGTEWHDIGFVAVILQFIGATLFEFAVILAVPGVLPEETPTRYAAWDATVWTFQTVGAWGFIISAGIFMFETQRKWYILAPLSLGWQIGLWNLIGALGFEASAVFGYLAAPRDVAQRWGTAFSTYWGGWGFLIGSYFQLLECLNKHPEPVGKKPAHP